MGVAEGIPGLLTIHGLEGVFHKLQIPSEISFSGQVVKLVLALTEQPLEVGLDRLHHLPGFGRALKPVDPMPCVPNRGRQVVFSGSF